MCKIAIITFHYQANYGAAMQVWALQEYLKGGGHHVTIVDYRPSHHTTGGSFWLPFNFWRFRANLAIAYLKLKSFKHANEQQIKAKLFDHFHQHYLNLSQNLYRNRKELARSLPDADVFICGSDQIWHASKQYGIDPVYLLSEIGGGARRVSYGASFGCSDMPVRFRKILSKYLRDFDAISVREGTAIKFVSGLSGREVACVPDPTLLLGGEYKDAENPPESGYTFSYTLRSRELASQVEHYIERRTGQPVISPERLSMQGRLRELSPLRWLGYIKYSDRVITNSYHGTLFAVIFQKPFVYVALGGRKAAYNERARYLLERLGLMDRFLIEFDSEQIDSLLFGATDWGPVQERITKWRIEAKEFLSAALNIVA